MQNFIPAYVSGVDRRVVTRLPNFQHLWVTIFSYAWCSAIKTMNDHNVGDETMRRSFNNAFLGVTKSKYTNFSFRISCQIRWFLGVADWCNHLMT